MCLTIRKRWYCCNEACMSHDQLCLEAWAGHVNQYVANKQAASGGLQRESRLADLRALCPNTLIPSAGEGAHAQGVHDHALRDRAVPGDRVAAAGVVEQLHVARRVGHVVGRVGDAAPRQQVWVIIATYDTRPNKLVVQLTFLSPPV